MNVFVEVFISGISVEDFECFCEYFYCCSGIYFELIKCYFVDKCFIDCIQVVGCVDFCEYFLLLCFEILGCEWQWLVNEMMVNEIYFMCEYYQFDCMVQLMLFELVVCKLCGELMCIWIMLLFFGEEVYMVVMYLLECWLELVCWDVEIVFLDIDICILVQVEVGFYLLCVVYQLLVFWLQKYFICEGENWCINCSLCEVVVFICVNLNECVEVVVYCNYDLVFCCNLLIYFDDVLCCCVVEVFYDVLCLGGFICLGYLELMSCILLLFVICKFV